MRALRGASRVHPNIIVQGKLSEVGREVDLKIVDPNDYDFMAFECKDHKRPVDVPLVEAFATKLRDINAASGAMVSNSGYTKAALTMASKLGIGTLALVDTGDAEIRTRVSATTLIRDLYVGGIWVGVVAGNVLPTNADELILTDKRGRERPATDVVMEVWSAHGIPHERGDHQLPLAEWGYTAWKTPNGAGTIPGLDIRVRISERCNVGALRVLNTEGLYDVQKRTYETHSFMTEGIGHETPNGWPAVTSEEADGLERTGGISITVAVSSVAGPKVERRIEQSLSG